MVHRLADALDVPARERNGLLETAGFEGSYVARDLEDSPMKPFCLAIKRVLRVHEPFPAMVLNRWWDVVDANLGAKRLFSLLEPKQPPTNMVEWFFSADPAVAERFQNWDDAAFTFLARVRREALMVPSDVRLQRLLALAERRLADVAPPSYDPTSDFMVCPALKVGEQVVRLAGMVSRFGAAREVTLDELRLETMYPQDDVTEAFFRRLAEEPALRVAQ